VCHSLKLAKRRERAIVGGAVEIVITGTISIHVVYNSKSRKGDKKKEVQMKEELITI